MGLGNLQKLLGRMFLKCRFRMGTWTVSGFQHEHLATPTLVNTADWLSLALAHLPGTVKPWGKLTNYQHLSLSFLFFVFISLPYSDDGWEWEFLLLHSSRDSFSFSLSFLKDNVRTCQSQVSKCSHQRYCCYIYSHLPFKQSNLYDEKQ